MTAPPVTIRRAAADDAASLAAFGARVFRAAFAAENDAEDMRLHLARTYTAPLQAAEIALPGCRCLLALEATTIVGYACLQQGAMHAAVGGAAPCEIRRFYVDPARHGTGVATTLMAAAAADARASGARTLWLGCWERSPRALRFYAKQGFVDVGYTTFVLGRNAQTDRLLVRALA